jgi:putative aldouronate transport system substrate-binding protein
VPASSKKTELAVKVLDWMSSEAGYMVGGLGIEGQDYTLVDRVPTPINWDSYLARVPWIEPQHGLMAKPYPRPEDKNLFLLNYIKDFNPDYHEQIKEEANFLSDIKYFSPTISQPTPVSDKVTPVITSFWNEEIAKIVSAPPANFDRVFDTAVRQYREMGGDDLVAEVQRLYR